MTYASPLSCSVLMSKFMRRSPEGRWPSGRPLGVSLSARPKPQSPTDSEGLAEGRSPPPHPVFPKPPPPAVARADRRRALGERLDLSLDLLLLRSVRVDLQIPLERIGRDPVVAGVLGCRGQLLEEHRVTGSELRRGLVVLHGAPVRADGLLVQQRGPGRRLLRRIRVGRVLADRRTQSSAGQELGARVCGLRRLLRLLVLRRGVAAGRQLEAAELAPRGRVVLLHGEVALKRLDGQGGIALLLVRGGEVAVALGLGGILFDLVLGLGDGAAAAAAQDAVVEALQAAAVTGADPEAREAQSEDDRQDEVQPPLVPPEADEEKLLIRVAAAAVATPPARTRLRRLGLCLRRLLRLDRCSGHQPPRVAEAGAAFAWRRSTSTASQIDPSKRIHIGRSSRKVVTGSGPGSASAIAAVIR